MTVDAPVIYVVRHAHAFARERWSDDDALRPLSPLGVSQSEAIAKRLAEAAVDFLCSSPAVRCVATLEPLAAMISKPIERLDELAEGGGGEQALERLIGLVAQRQGLVACTHGDVVEEMLDVLNARGTVFHSRRASPKAGTWELTVGGGSVTDARLVRAPEV